ncbi:J domain-containing protein [Psychromicrobium sp. YIM B11713]|uniref:J domain-containing protein n=1 Tax=Psychromicrobium sp. YIM B11713 TaxID=3145233 RepID=UPI00374E6DFA
MSRQYRTHYEVLQIEVTATSQQVKAAYRRAVRTAHPDHGGSAEDFRRVSEAYQTLIDPALRKAYDRSYASAGSPSAGFSTPRPTAQTSSASELPVFVPAFDGSTTPVLSLELASRQIHGAPRKRGLFGAQARLVREARTIELVQQQILNRYPAARILNGLHSPVDNSYLDHVVMMGYRLAVIGSMMVPEGAYRWNGSTLVHGSRGVEPPKILSAVHALGRIFPECTVSGWIVVQSPSGNPYQPVIDYTRGNEPDGGPGLNLVGAARLGRDLGSFLAVGETPNVVDLQLLSRLLGGMY